jgi:hypothetical protein
MSTTKTAPLADDAAFLAAERRIAELREKKERINATHGMWALYFNGLALSPPVSPVSAIVFIAIDINPRAALTAMGCNGATPRPVWARRS